MLLMKQARAFGVGVVLSTQNPVDVDYKAISNAGTWMVGRLQTDRDKQRLLDGMSAAAGTVDVGAVGDTISGLAKREFVLRRAGKDQPEVFTTRWAMSYLRGPMTRDQIAAADARRRAAPHRAGRADRWRRRRAPRCRRPTRRPAAPAARSRPPPRRAADPDVTPVMPEVGGGVAVRWVDPAAPWLGARRRRADVDDARRRGRRPRRPALRRHQGRPRPRRGVRGGAVPARRRTSTSRRPSPSTTTTATCATRPRRRSPTGSTDAPIGRAVVLEPAAQGPRRPPHAQPGASRSRRTPTLKLYGRPGESAPTSSPPAAVQAAGDKADAETAKLRDKYEAKVVQAAVADRRGRRRRRRRRRRSSRPASATTCCRRPARSSAACSAGAARRAACSASSAGPPGAPARRRRPASRVEAAQGKVDRLEAAAAGRRGRAGRGAHRDRRPLGRRRPPRSTTMSIGLEKYRRQGHPARRWPGCPAP